MLLFTLGIRVRAVLAVFLCLVACRPNEHATDADSARPSAGQPPAGLPDSTISGTALNVVTGRPFPDTLLSLAHVRTASGDEIQLRSLVPGSPPRIIRTIARRSLPPLQPGEYVALGQCSLAGKPEVTVAAVVWQNSDYTQERVRLAWRADTSRETIEDLSTAQVDCLDEESQP